MMSNSKSEAAAPLKTVLTSSGQSLWELSETQKLLIVFLRHSGCTFCRQALSDLQKIRTELAAEKVQIVIVSMSSADSIQKELTRFDLPDVISVSDPEQVLYRHFELGDASVAHMLSPQVMWYGFKACILERHGIGGKEGDIKQMPGVFLIQNGETLASFKHASVADRPNYLEIVRSAG